MEWNQNHKRFYKYMIYEVLSSFLEDEERGKEDPFKITLRSIYWNMARNNDGNMDKHNILCNYLILADLWDNYYSLQYYLDEKHNEIVEEYDKLIMDKNYLLNCRKEQLKLGLDYLDYHSISKHNPFKRQEQLYEKKMREDLEKYKQQKENE